MNDPRFTKQSRILERWIPIIAQLPEVQVVWLEGSLADGRGDPGSDIDIRIAIRDDAYPQLWELDRSPLFAGLGQHLLLFNDSFVRALTYDGVLVELAAYQVSSLQDLELYEWRFLLNRLPEGQPTFRRLPKQDAAHTWPAAPSTVEDVRARTFLMLNLMATAAPSAFHQEEWLSAGYLLDFLRNQLIQIMYQRIGLRFSKRIKHLSVVLPPDFQADLTSTYPRPGESSLDPAVLAAAILRTLQAVRKHLHTLSDTVGGGFDTAWFDRMYQYTECELVSLYPNHSTDPS